MLGSSARSANDGREVPSQDSPKSFHFFQLPLELRREIYGHVLVQEKQPLRLIETTKTQKTTDDHSTAILTTSRQVNAEASPIFLSGNTFKINGHAKHWQWLKNLGADGQKALRNVVFASTSEAHSFPYSHAKFRTFNILAGCPKLSLTISMRCWQLAELYRMGTFRYLHRFSEATYVLKEDRVSILSCRQHRMLLTRDLSERNAGRDRGHKAIQMLLQDCLSACPERCPSHRSRKEPHSASTLHIMCWCEYPFCLLDICLTDLRRSKG